MRAGDRVAAAVSGGADSVALLCLLLELRAELGIVLSIAHVNHKLRGEESDEDERFVAKLARQYGLDFYVREAGIDDGDSSGIEAAARERRYEFFPPVGAGGPRFENCHGTHSRRSGRDGASSHFSRHRDSGSCGHSSANGFQGAGARVGRGGAAAARLSARWLLEFLRERDQSWREDSSNRDLAFLRNRVRHRLLPMIGEEFGEAAIEHMGELAEIARAEEEMTSTQYSVPSSQQTGASLLAGPLLALPLAAQRRVVRAWLETNGRDLSISFRLIEEALELARGPAGKKMELPEATLRRGRLDLLLELRSRSLAGTSLAGGRGIDKRRIMSML